MKTFLKFLSPKPETRSETKQFFSENELTKLRFVEIVITYDFQTQVIKTTKLISHAMKKALSPSGLIIKQFNGPDAGQTVFHYHMHIIPVYNGAPNKNHGYEMEKPEKLESIANRIAAEI